MSRASQAFPSLTDLMTSETAEVYERQRELTLPVTCQLPSFSIEQGRRPGTKFAVFSNSGELFEFSLLMPWVFEDCPVVNYGEFDNAFDITHWWKGH